MKEIRAGDVMLIGTAKGFVPKAIRYFTKCKYNHAGIVVDYLGDLYMLEAQERGFHPSNRLDNWLTEKKKNKDNVLFIRPKRIFFLKDVYVNLSKMVGANYEFTNLVFFQLIKAMTGIYFGSRDSKTVICSEAVAYAYPELFEEPFSTTPEEIYENPEFFEVLKLNFK
jgi:hypothetical protein